MTSHAPPVGTHVRLFPGQPGEREGNIVTVHDSEPDRPPALEVLCSDGTWWCCVAVEQVEVIA